MCSNVPSNSSVTTTTTRTTTVHCKCSESHDNALQQESKRSAPILKSGGSEQIPRNKQIFGWLNELHHHHHSSIVDRLSSSIVAISSVRVIGSTTYQSISASRTHGEWSSSVWFLKILTATSMPRHVPRCTCAYAPRPSSSRSVISDGWMINERCMLCCQR
jgi:hypothetical protein